MKGLMEKLREKKRPRVGEVGKKRLYGSCGARDVVRNAGEHGKPISLYKKLRA